LSREDELALEELMLAAGGKLAYDWGWAEDAPCLDGESEGMKLRRVEAWLAAPGPDTLAACAGAIDGSRQLEI
jgi:hypothetical protein